MNIVVSLVRAYSDGMPVSLTLPIGSTVGNAAANAGAPSGCRFSVNGQSAEGSTTLGEGDTIIASKGKVDAG